MTNQNQPISLPTQYDGIPVALEITAPSPGSPKPPLVLRLGVPGDKPAMNGPSVVCRRTQNAWEIAIAMAGSDVFGDVFVAWSLPDSKLTAVEVFPRCDEDYEADQAN